MSMLKTTYMSDVADNFSLPKIMFSKMFLVFQILFTILFVNINNLSAEGVSRIDLAEYWAPIIFQKVDVFNEGNGLGGRADFITKFDFDYDDSELPTKNICGNDNWDNIAEIQIPSVSYDYPLLPYVYYDVKETTTHWFIYYAVFHPRDWGYISISALEHENDMESMLFVIKRDGTDHGELIIIESMAHNIWMNYPIDPNITVDQGESDINEGLNRYGVHRYVAFIEARGHGIYFDTVDCIGSGVKDNWYEKMTILLLV